MISIKPGSILDAEVEAIVNPANGHLRHGGGLARIIDLAAQTTAAGQRVDYTLKREPNEFEEPYRSIAQYQKDHREAPLVAVANNVVTTAGVLPFRAIIHAVGPIWNGGDFMECDLLEVCHERVFERALDEGFSSVAVPAISCGIFGFPPERAASIALGVAVGFEDELDIEFYPFGFESLYEAAQARLAGS